MTTLSTSLADSPLPPATLIKEWSRFGAFLTRPVLPQQRGGERNGFVAVGRLLGLDMIIMLLFVLALSAAGAFGFELPENVNNQLGLTLVAITLVVIVAPLGEELVFRSWLAGHPAVLAAAAICLVGFGLIPFVAILSAPDGNLPLWAHFSPVIAGLAAVAAAIALRKAEVPRLFARGFPFFFWFSVIGFALVHIANYSEGFTWVVLPLVLPQFALGTMLGYLRVHYGLIHAIALHAIHNAILFSLAMIGQSVAGT